MMKKREGFAIAELVLGFMFLTVFLLTNIMIHINALNNVKEIQRQTTAINLIIDKLEDIQASQYSNVISESAYQPYANSNYEITVEVDELTNPIDLVDYYDFIKHVTVTINYTVGGKQETIEISTLKVGTLELIPVEPEITE